MPFLPSNQQRQSTEGYFYRNAIQSNTSMHHYECVALCKYTGLQRGRFCARSLASYIPRSSEDTSSWMFFIYSMCSVAVGGRLQFSGGGCSNMASASICVLIHSCKMLPKEIGTTGLRGLLQLRYEHVTIRVRFEYDSSTIRLKHATTRYEVFRALAYEIDSSTPRESVVVVSCMLIDSSMHTIFAL